MKGLGLILCVALLVGSAGKVARIELWDRSAPLLPASRDDLRRGFALGSDGKVFGVVSGPVRGETVAAARFLAWDHRGRLRTQRLSAESSSAETPAILHASNGYLHAVWLGRKGRGDAEVIAAVSRDSGATWKEKKLAAGRSGGRSPLIVEDGRGGLHICFSGIVAGESDERIFLFRSTDRGESWKPSEVNFRKKKGFANTPRIATRGDTVVIVWCDQTPGGVAVVANASQDAGETWLSEPTAVSRDPNLVAEDVDLLLAGDKLCVFWKTRMPDRLAVRMAESRDGGTNWAGGEAVFSRRVSKITYRPVALGEDCWVFWTEGEVSSRKGPARLFYGPALAEKLTEPLEKNMVEKEGIYLTEFDVLARDHEFVVGTIIRAARDCWKVKYFIAKPDGNATDLTDVESGSGKERSALLLVGRGEEVGFLYQEGNPRRFPMQSPFKEIIVLNRVIYTSHLATDELEK